MCALLEVARSHYYKLTATAPVKRNSLEDVNEELMCQIFASSK